MFNFGPKIPEITTEDVKHSIDTNDNVVILDVRTPDEVTRGKIKKSINLSVDQIDSGVEKIISDKNQKIYVYCLSGSRSAMAVQTMIKIGYKNVFSMSGGMLTWRAKQFPVEN